MRGRALLEKDKVVAPVDVLAGMGLEQAVDCNLTRLSRLLRILRFHAHDLKLVPSETVYVRYGSRQRLRFTKTGDARLEQAYARHFIWPGKGPFLMPAPKPSAQRELLSDSGAGAGKPQDPRS